MAKSQTTTNEVMVIYVFVNELMAGQRSLRP
jgi:hypothetical protein